MSALTPTIHVLVIEDDSRARRLLAASLEAQGYAVHQAASAGEGEALAGSQRIDLFIIDLGLPDRDGLEVIEGLRQWTQRPIIVVSGRADEPQKVAALDAGADDYLTKPFGTAELHARIRVALRHAAQTARTGESVLHFGEVRLDLEAKSVQRAGQTVRLTATEWRLLEVLARHVGRVVTSQQLLREVWGPRHLTQGHYLRIYIRQLRHKLEEQPATPIHLLTETGIGYRFVTDPH